jgi:hypothetical protein
MTSTISQKAGFLAPAVLSTGFLPSEGAASAIAGHTERSTPIAAPASRGTAKNIGLFLAAPFIGLAYLVALPFAGLVMLARLSARAALATPATA